MFWRRGSEKKGGIKGEIEDGRFCGQEGDGKSRCQDEVVHGLFNLGRHGCKLVLV